MNIGSEEKLEGVVDLVTMKALYNVGEKGEKVEPREIPPPSLSLPSVLSGHAASLSPY